MHYKEIIAIFITTRMKQKRCQPTGGYRAEGKMSVLQFKLIEVWLRKNIFHEEENPIKKCDFSKLILFM